MTREEKIKVIYAEMANKELAFGCKVKNSKNEIEMICSELVNNGTSFSTIPYPEGRWCGFTTIYHLRNLEWINLDSKRTIKEINGHPVMIGDVLDWLDKKICLLIDQGKDIEKLLKGSDVLNLRLLNIWKHKSKPLDEQPDRCIDYVTNLLDQFGSVI